jgi:secondary thiamine-phosphate synthase enzyme
MHQQTLSFQLDRRGLHDISQQVREVVRASGVGCGMCNVFVRHTSASLTIQENADPDVQRDLEVYMRRLVPDGDPIYRHVDEGPDDMPAHVCGALTDVSLSIPVAGGEPALGTWQGIYLWEHRSRARTREVVVTVWGM